MAERILNTRIITKHADLATWESSTLPLKEGEIVLAKFNVAQPDGTAAPTFVAKVGNGSTYAESPYLFAKAADVYAWAKKANLALTDIPEIALDSAAAAKIKAAIDAKANQTALEAEQTARADADAALGARIAAIEGSEGTVAIALAAAKEYADGLNTAMNTRVAAIESDYLKAADKTALQNAIDAEATARETGDTDTLNAAKEDASAKDTALHTTISGEIASAVNTAKSDLQTNIDKKVDKTTYDAKIATLETADTNLGTRLTTAEGEIDALQDRLADVTNVMDFAGAFDALPDATQYQDGDVVVITGGDDSGKEFVLSDGIWVEFGSTTAADAAITQLQADVEALEGKVNTAGTVSSAIEAAVAAETANREAADADILEIIGTVGDNTTVVAMIAAAEAAAKAYADANDTDTIYDDTAVRNLITTNANAIAAEKTRAEDAESELQTAITDEETRAKAAEEANADALAVLNGDATTEGSVAKAIADSAATLQTAIAAKADQTALEAEQTARADADTALGNRITTLEEIDHSQYALASDLTTLAGRVTTAEGKISTLEGEMDSAETAIDNIETDIATNVVKVSGSNLVVGADVIIFDCGGAE